MFEGSSHVPLLFMGPGLVSGVEAAQLVSLVDIHPTVLGGEVDKSVVKAPRCAASDYRVTFYCADLAGVPPVGGLSGRSLLPLLSKSSSSPARPHPDWVLSEYHGCNANASTYMLRSGRWKYIAYADGLRVPPQLFGELQPAGRSNRHLNPLDCLCSHPLADMILDKEELRDVASQFPEVSAQLDELLRSIVPYPEVSAAVHLYNRKAFVAWRRTLGRNYSQVISSLRWHVDWQRDPLANERAIDKWLYGSF